MTRKEAIDRLDIIVSKHEVDDVYITLTNEKDYKALKVAINSLRIDERYELEYEQAEPKTDVLNKIRSEILDNAFSVVNPKNTYEYINVLNLDSIEKIFDKYKAESEE